MSAIESEPFVQYASKTSATFSFTLPQKDGPKRRFHFQQGILKIPHDDIETIEAIDTMLDAMPNMQKHVVKVDKEAALKLIEEFEASARSSAAKGPFSTANMDEMRRRTVSASAKALADMAPNNPEALHQFKEELAHGDMEITEFVSPNPDAKPDETVIDGEERETRHANRLPTTESPASPAAPADPAHTGSPDGAASTTKLNLFK